MQTNTHTHTHVGGAPGGRGPGVLLAAVRGELREKAEGEKHDKVSFFKTFKPGKNEWLFLLICIKCIFKH